MSPAFSYSWRRGKQDHQCLEQIQDSLYPNTFSLTGRVFPFISGILGSYVTHPQEKLTQYK